jgi:short-subunit dehydrogenase
LEVAAINTLEQSIRRAGSAVMAAKGALPMNRQTDKGTALITGASSGIGALYADRLARRGYDLILVARNTERLDSLAARLESETLAMVETVSADLNEMRDLRRIEDILRNDPAISLLVNNAGMGLYAPILQSDPDTMQRMISLNVTALMRLSHAAAKSFVARGDGAIVNIASIVALAPELLNATYGGTKAFVLAFSQSLRQELSDTGVRVQVVLPGATATEFWGNAGKPVTELPPQIVMSAEDMVDAALAGFDLGEFATIPSLPDIDDWLELDAARLALRPNLSHMRPAARYAAERSAAA